MPAPYDYPKNRSAGDSGGRFSGDRMRRCRTELTKTDPQQRRPIELKRRRRFQTRSLRRCIYVACRVCDFRRLAAARRRWGISIERIGVGLCEQLALPAGWPLVSVAPSARIHAPIFCMPRPTTEVSKFTTWCDDTLPTTGLGHTGLPLIYSRLQKQSSSQLLLNPRSG